MWNWSLGKAPGGVGRDKIPPGQALGVPSKASRSGLSIRAPRATSSSSPTSNNLDGAGNGGQDSVQDQLLPQPCQTHH